MTWFSEILRWYIYLLGLGFVFLPLTIKIFPSFFDKGYAFAKTLGIIFLSYAIFVLSLLHLLPFNQYSLFLILVFVIIAYLVYSLRHPSFFLKVFIFVKENLPLLLFEEILFFAGLVFLAFVRGQEPSIHGLEKFMDYGFMKSILRTDYFPPLDMWLSADPNQPTGYPINYYYFGHLSGALLIKLTEISSSIGYNLILATIFAQGMSLTFSIVANFVYFFQKNFEKSKSINYLHLIIYGLLGSFVINLTGNLHTIYLFTTGYPNDNPIPFWKILSGYNPLKYWYPNATRFIPFTIHEFPSYSYVVADLHGHVFDIPFVLLTLAILLKFFLTNSEKAIKNQRKEISNRSENPKLKTSNIFLTDFYRSRLISTSFNRFQLISTIFLGFMCAIHYMTNAFDGPIYILLTIAVLFFLQGPNSAFLISSLTLVASFSVFALPFSANFSPFVSGIGVNCSPDFLVNLHKFGPFLFEKDNCQISPPWMLFILWGFFWVNFALFLITTYINRKKTSWSDWKPNQFIFLLFSFSTCLVIIPEFFYIKDIYPAHFRANTMFKLGYQAFMIMGLASVFTFYQLRSLPFIKQLITKIVFLFFFFFVFVYPFFAFPSYYGKLDRPVNLDGSTWLTRSYPNDKEIINYLNENITGQPVILEAQGDSYTDYERISAFTGLPTVAGWWVHEWLWRGSSSVIGNRIPDVAALYESHDVNKTIKLLNKYHVEYVVVSTLEKEKYKNLYEDKFLQIGKKVFQTSDGSGALYQVKI